MRSAIFPGTFDPPTFGHLEIIERAAKLFDHLIIAIGKNLQKGVSLLRDEEKLNALGTMTGHLKNVEISFFSGLVTDFAKEKKATVLVRGMRHSADFEYEMQLAHANRVLGNIETFFLITDETAFISSTLIRELAANGASLEKFIPKDLAKILQSKLKKEI